jgi:arylformamidase
MQHDLFKLQRMLNDFSANLAIGRRLPKPEREREYSPSSAIGDNYAPFITVYKDMSQAAHAALPQRQTSRYGDLPRQQIDYFPAKASTQVPGLLVFIHGGYWQELSKNESAFLASAWHAAGFAHAVIGYTLAPQASVRGIMRECVSAIAHLRERAPSLGFDASRIVVAGSSAGGYLAAAVAAHAQLEIRGIVPISGIFDLRPLVGTSINDALGLTIEEAQALSALALSARTPAVIAWGEIETAAFKAQSQMLASQLTAAQIPVQSMELAGRNHFDVVHELGDTQSPLFQATLKLIE